jgi:thiol-disulfide isomerase/thioredoxin
MSVSAASDIPDLELEDLNGNKQSIDSYIGKGKWTVVNIWGPGCPPCEQELPELVMFHDQNSSSRAIVVGIAISFPSYGYAEVEKVKDYADRFLIDFPVLLSDASVSEKLGNGFLTGLPTTYVYAPDGELVGMHVGAITSEILTNFIDQYINRILNK